ncbi:MAG: hypothetical protein JRI72_12015 [Deltaproteobacteria bacterium]|nr:hypothetical protein [Deltaproteobacteria bacterium]
MQETDMFNPSEKSEIKEKNRQLDSYSFEEVKKLYNKSRNVSAIGGICVFLAVIYLLGFLLFFPSSESSQDELFVMVIFFGVMVFFIISAIGIFKRTNWGRTLGIIFCVLLLLAIPIGTIIGVVGIMAFSSAPELFGGNNLTHNEIEIEFNKLKTEVHPDQIE